MTDGPVVDGGAEIVIEADATGAADAPPTTGSEGLAAARVAAECTLAPREAAVTRIGPVRAASPTEGSERSRSAHSRSQLSTRSPTSGRETK